MEPTLPAPLRPANYRRGNAVGLHSLGFAALPLSLAGLSDIVDM
jgi:hypothetical protein